MELSLICPIEHLEHTYNLPGRFCIASVAKQSSKYREFFREASDTGNYNVIMDNGVFEEHCMLEEDYKQMIDYIKPRVLILQDHINANWQTNLEYAQRQAKEYKQVYPTMELMFVVQCQAGDDDGFWAALSQAINTKEIDYIGICRDAVANAFSKYTRTNDQELNRFYFASQLQSRLTLDEILSVKWHFLGIGDHVHILKHYWFVTSMDTASFFWHGSRGHLISDDGVLVTDIKRPKDYFTRPYCCHDELVTDVAYNCQRAQQYAQQADELRRQIIGGRI